MLIRVSSFLYKYETCLNNKDVCILKLCIVLCQTVLGLNLNSGTLSTDVGQWLNQSGP